jgi:hypothetical protein
MPRQEKAPQSTTCEFSFPAACTRSTLNVASAQVSMPLRSMKTGHTRIVQRTEIRDHRWRTKRELAAIAVHLPKPVMHFKIVNSRLLAMLQFGQMPALRKSRSAVAQQAVTSNSF